MANHSKLDKVFSEYTRRKDACEYGRTKCITCGTFMHWAEMDCSHWIRRSHMATRWMETNAHSACKMCNQVNDGEEDKHKAYIEERYGFIEVIKLLELKQTEVHFTQYEIDEMTDMYKLKLKQI